MIPASGDVFSVEYRFTPDAGLENNLRVVAKGGQDLLSFLEESGCDEAEIFALNLAYEELMTNVPRHVVGKTPAGVRVRCRVAFLGGEANMRYADDGPAFDPLANHSSPADPTSGRQGGLGLELIRTFFPEMRYSYEKGWNTVNLGRRVRT